MLPAILFFIKHLPIFLFVLSILFSLLALYRARDFNFNVIANIFLDYFMVFNIGIIYLVAFVIHVFFKDAIATLIGWPVSMFEWQVGFACLSYGIVGILSFGASNEFKAATLLMATIFLCGVSIIHFYYVHYDTNYLAKDNNFYFLIDIAIHLTGLFILYVAWRSKNQKIVLVKT